MHVVGLGPKTLVLALVNGSEVLLIEGGFGFRAGVWTNLLGDCQGGKTQCPGKGGEARVADDQENNICVSGGSLQCQPETRRSQRWTLGTLDSNRVG